MKTTPVRLIGGQFIPATSFTGNEPASIFRGRNAVVRGLGGFPYVENYPGSKDLGEDYNIATWALTGTCAITANSDEVVGTGTSFQTELRPGQFLIIATELIVVDRVIDDLNFVAAKAPTTSASGQTARKMPVLFEIDKQRGVLERGNGIVIENKDIIYVGQGNLHLNGVDTGFAATRVPKRLQRAADGTYTEFPFGFQNPPPPPVVSVTTDGVKGMLAGDYSFLFSWWNSVTGGFSNPTPVIKQVAGGTDITIAASGRFGIDISTLLAAKPTNADGILIWGSLSGGGVTAVNDSNFAEGPWYDIRRMRFASQNVVSTDATTDQVTLPSHKYQDGDYVVLTNVGGLTGSYYLIRDGFDLFRVAATVADYKSKTVVALTTTSGVGTVSHFNASDVAYFEYLDSETGGVASADNDAPGECEWVTEFVNQLFFISTLGNRKADSEIPTSPGNYVIPGKGGNREAAPLRWRVSVNDEITGFAKAVGRLFVLTRTGVPFITPTARTELARLQPTLENSDLPFVYRPFWTKGGISPYNLTVVQGDVYAYSGRQPLRSPSGADEKSVPFELGKLIQTLTKDVPDGQALAVHDPKNQQMCFILSGIRKNASGYWESDIIPLDLMANPSLWQPVITLSSTTRDMIVSGAAIINNRLEFLAGGRVSGGTFEVSTYRYDERSGSGSIPWFVAFQPTDMNEEQRAKFIESFRITGRMAAPVVQVHGSNWNSPDFDPDDIVAGTNSISGNIVLASSSEVERQFRKKHKVKNLTLFSVRVSDTWTDTGSNEYDRMDELIIAVGVHGKKQ